MKCPSCGSENLAGTDLCENCFASLATSPSSPSSPRYLKSNVLNDLLKNVELRPSPIVQPSATVREGIRAMKEMGMGCLLVVDGKNLIGIFTERDVVQKLAFPQVDLDAITIEAVMTPVPEVLSEENTISAALNKMSMGNYRHVPIEKSDGTYAYFSVKDALRYLF